MDKAKSADYRALLPMGYTNPTPFRQRICPCLAPDPPRTTNRSRPWPVPISTANYSTNSMPATSVSSSEWAKTKPSADYTAKLAANASASGKARCWSTPNCQNQPWSASSNAWDTAAPSKPRLTSVRLTTAACSDYWRRPGGGLCFFLRWSTWCAIWTNLQA